MLKRKNIDFIKFIFPFLCFSLVTFIAFSKTKEVDSVRNHLLSEKSIWSSLDSHKMLLRPYTRSEPRSHSRVDSRVVHRNESKLVNRYF